MISIQENIGGSSGHENAEWGGPAVAEAIAGRAAAPPYRTTGEEFDRKKQFTRRADLRHRPAELQAEMARRLESGECTQKELAVWLEAEHQIVTQQQGVSRWFAWYRMPARPWNRPAIIEKAVAKLRKMNPRMSEDRVFEKGQKLFAEMAIEERDLDGWVKSQRLMIARRNTKVREARLKFDEAWRKAKVKAQKKERKMKVGTTKTSMSRFERDLGLMGRRRKEFKV